MTHPQGITVEKLSNSLNRPISRVQSCLKSLLAVKVIQSKRLSDSKKWIYYPASVFSLKYN
ncbi:hypothetical protein [cyanobacterium endosymbiont of Epithemia turgida]|uniref:hypothetical protein n=1 Tax=cyanobacterium endosymbiont of Epithemia turgida TaxID=718217 RepID=UPI0004D1F8AC|nr:hypothetical protein [cyanobacterium endosymbiont of Epithemia turgida]BAP18330.1 hypothetical protein ETSB_1605 [cyanobacterium endosymbiont of Epithemia turgida isolate EtSB Lake Yunoko]